MKFSNHFSFSKLNSAVTIKQVNILEELYVLYIVVCSCDGHCRSLNAPLQRTYIFAYIQLVWILYFVGNIFFWFYNCLGIHQQRLDMNVKQKIKVKTKIKMLSVNFE